MKTLGTARILRDDEKLKFQVLKGIRKGRVYFASGYDNEHFHIWEHDGDVEGFQYIPRTLCEVIAADGFDLTPIEEPNQDVIFPFSLRGNVLNKTWVSSHPAMGVACSDGLNRFVVLPNMWLITFMSRQFGEGAEVEMEISRFFIKSAGVFEGSVSSNTHAGIKKRVLQR